jgi:toxin YoeB
MRRIVFTQIAISEMHSFKAGNAKLVFKILELIDDIQKHPFEGIGKPEALKGNLSGFWSRRINDEHRLVYKISNGEIHIVKCKDHYKT